MIVKKALVFGLIDSFYGPTGPFSDKVGFNVYYMRLHWILRFISGLGTRQNPKKT